MEAGVGKIRLTILSGIIGINYIYDLEKKTNLIIHDSIMFVLGICLEWHKALDLDNMNKCTDLFYSNKYYALNASLLTFRLKK